MVERAERVLKLAGGSLSEAGMVNLALEMVLVEALAEALLVIEVTVEVVAEGLVDGLVEGPEVFVEILLLLPVLEVLLEVVLELLLRNACSDSIRVLSVEIFLALILPSVLLAATPEISSVLLLTGLP